MCDPRKGDVPKIKSPPKEVPPPPFPPSTSGGGDSEITLGNLF